MPGPLSPEALESALKIQDLIEKQREEEKVPREPGKESKVNLVPPSQREKQNGQS